MLHTEEGTKRGLMLKVFMKQVESCRDKAMCRDMMQKLSKLVKMSSSF